jgi:hypothetical protein
MSDLISRQAAIDALDVLCQEHRYKIPGKEETYSQYNEAWQDALDRAEGAIFNLWPAEPKRGKWIYAEDSMADCVDGYRCDQCGLFVPWDYKHKGIDYIKDYNFCPNCGADMRGEHNESN